MDGMLVVATELGEIIICDNNCQYVGFVSQPTGYQNRIDSILPFPRGFIITQNGTI